MAKVNCEDCGKEIGIVQQVQLADKSTYAGRARKKQFLIFNI